MIITPLGHTQFLIDMNNPSGESIKIMIDAWMSDYVLGDLMERTVKVIPDFEKIAELDAVYISHSHSDHFDPYSLIRIFDEKFAKKPMLILPFTLEYLVPMLREYLGEIDIKILFPDEKINIRGVDFAGHMFSQSNITNEDDVMMISANNGEEIIFAEIDTLPEEDNYEVQQKIYNLLTAKKYKTVLYMASRNEMEGSIPLFDTAENKRKNFRSEYLSERKMAMRYSYEKFLDEDFEDFPNIFTIPGFCRAFIGQGITYPEILDPKLGFAKIFPLDEIASIESDYAKNFDYNFPQKAMNAGKQYKVENGQIETGRKDCPIGKLVVSHENNAELTGERKFSKTPLLQDFPLTESEKHYEEKILEILNNKFLPYWSASAVASLRDALIKNYGKYQIAFRDNMGENFLAFEFSTAKNYFTKIDAKTCKNPDESYFYRDFIDYMEGRQELYSNFWHILEPKKIYRLWTCLGANFMNHDLVEAKYRFHFERAKNGESINSFVEPILEKMK